MRQIASQPSWRQQTATARALTSGKSLFRSILVLLGFLIAFSPSDLLAQINLDGSPADWASHLLANPQTSKRIPDGTNRNADPAFTEGSSDNLLISQWAWNSNGANAKSDIANAGFAFIGTRLYFFVDRISNNGTANIGFWLTKTPIGLVGTTTGTFSGDHSLGDVLIQIDYTQGGTLASANAFKWNPAFPNNLEPIPQQNPPLWEATTNTAPVNIPAGWNYFPQGTAQYDFNSFFEGWVDLPGVGLSDLDVCSGTFLANTRVSASVTASLGDFVLGRFADAPTPNFTAAGTCASPASGSITNSNVQQGVTYTLSPGNISNQTGTFTGLAAGTYSITAVSVNSCSTTVSGIIVEPFPTPNCTIEGAQSRCAEAPAVTWTVGAGQGTYAWEYRATPGSGAWSPVGSNSNTLSVSNAGEYRVTITSANGCVCTSPGRTFTVNPTPNCTISGAQSRCAEAPAVNWTVGAGQGTYAWEYRATPGSGAWSPVGTNSNTLSVSNAGEYRVTITSAAGCVCTSDGRVFTVNPTPSCEISGAQSRCAESPAVTWTVPSAGAGATYAWEYRATPGSGAWSPVGTNSASLSVSNAGEYRVTVTSAAGCTCTSAGRTFTVNANPDCTITGPVSRCAEAPAVTWSVPAGQGTYAWEYRATPGSGAWSPVGTNSNSLSVSNAGEYRVTVTSGPGCICTSPGRTFTVNPTPNCTITGTMSRCANEPAPTWSVPAGQGTYKWEYSATGSAPWTEKGSSNTQVVTDAGWYRVTVTSAAGCICTSQARNHVVNPLPIVQELTGSTICTGASNGTVTQAGSQMGVTYQLQRWTNPTWTNVEAKAGTGGSLTWMGLVGGTYRVVATNNTTQCSTPFGDQTMVMEEVCFPICAASQGFYGNKGGNVCFDKMTYTTPDAMMNAFGALTEVKFGIGNRSFNLRKSDLDANIYRLLPGGGNSKAIDAYGANGVYYSVGAVQNFEGSWSKVPIKTASNTSNPNHGRIGNSLLAQTITTWFNWRNSSEMAGTRITNVVLATTPVQCDENNTPIKSVVDPTMDSVKYTELPAVIVEYLNSGNPKMNTIADLYALAIAYLGGETKSYMKGDETIVVPIGAITEALGQIIEAFHGCAFLVGQLDEKPMMEAITTTGAREIESSVVGLEVSAFPNPVVNNLRFVIRTEISGQAQLELVDAQGRLAQKAYSGYVQAGRNQTVDVNVSTFSSGPIFYRLTIGDETTTGKVIKINR